MTIFEELFAVSKRKEQKPGESDQEFLKSILEIVAKIPEKEFYGLSHQAQTWFNEAANSFNKLKTIPDCPGFKSKPILTINKPKPGTAISQLKDSLATRIQSPTPSIVTTELKPKGKRGRINTGVMDAIRKCVMVHPEWSSRKVHQHLKMHGWPGINLNTVAIDGGNIRRIIDLAKEMGFWKDEAYEKFRASAEAINPDGSTNPATSVRSS